MEGSCFFLLLLTLLGGPFASPTVIHEEVAASSSEGQDSVESPRRPPYPLFITDPHAPPVETTTGNVVGNRINRGEDATSVRSNYGYYVAILFDVFGAVRLGCGGSLVSPLFVLTAAHCLADASDPNGSVMSELRGISIGFFGSEQGDNLEPVKRVAARHYYVHEKYDAAFLAFDLGVVELEEPIFDFEPIVPDVGNIQLKLGDEVTAIGLGWDTIFSSPTKLQEKQLKIVPPSLCGDWWMTITRSSSESSIMCVYADYFAGGLCPGDSGGAIVKVADDDGPDTIIGVSSFGFHEGCDDTVDRRVPDGIARVAAGRDDLWGPLLCNSERVRSAKGPQGRRLRPSWCDGQEFATMTPPDPTPPRSQTEDDDDGFIIIIIGGGGGIRYPYYAGIEMEDSFSRLEGYECMGTLIHPHFVLTMAECVNGKFGDFFSISKVRVGLESYIDGFSFGSKYQDRKSVQVIAHPQFRPDGVWEMHNVALIRLDEPVSKSFAKRIPLLDDGNAYREALKISQEKQNNTKVVALGIGEATPESQLESFDLNDVKTTLVKDGPCGRSIKRFFDRKYGSDDDRDFIPDELFGCANRRGVEGSCLSPWPAQANPDRLIQWGSPLIISRRGKKKEERKKRDIVLGTFNFRTDDQCRENSKPDVYNRMSAYREWIQCVVCVGSIDAIAAATYLPPKADPLCNPKKLSPTLTQDCQDKFGISPGMYDEELRSQQAQPPTPTDSCLVDEKLERRNSTFALNPLRGEMAKCGMVAKDGLESLFCGESVVVQGARENCPHICGLCD